MMLICNSSFSVYNFLWFFPTPVVQTYRILAIRARPSLTYLNVYYHVTCHLFLRLPFCSFLHLFTMPFAAFARLRVTRSFAHGFVWLCLMQISHLRTVIQHCIPTLLPLPLVDDVCISFYHHRALLLCLKQKQHH